MGIQEKLLEDMNMAMKSGDKVAVNTYRVLRSQLKNAMIAKGEDISEQEAIEILSKEVKKRKESIEMYRKGNRADLADQETKEAEIISRYLPEALSEEEIASLVQSIIDETGAEDMSDMGKVMGVIMPKVKGRAEGKQIQDIVKRKLS